MMAQTAAIDRSTVTTEMSSFMKRPSFGCHQINGKASGPKENSITRTKENS